MNSEHIELSRRLVACKHFRWVPGMTLIPLKFPNERWLLCWSDNDYGGAYQTSGGKVWGIGYDGGDPIEFKDSDCDWIPDTSDPATLGCLLALVRKAWGDERISAAFAKAEGRFVIVDSLCSAMLADGRYFYGDTEAEALIAALEAAQ